MPVSDQLTGFFVLLVVIYGICAYWYCFSSYIFHSIDVQPQTIERMEIEPPWKLVLKNRIGSRASTAPAAYSNGK